MHFPRTTPHQSADAPLLTVWSGGLSTKRAVEGKAQMRIDGSELDDLETFFVTSSGLNLVSFDHRIKNRHRVFWAVFTSQENRGSLNLPIENSP